MPSMCVIICACQTFLSEHFVFACALAYTDFAYHFSWFMGGGQDDAQSGITK